jgi:hypothetical protein
MAWLGNQIAPIGAVQQFGSAEARIPRAENTA